MGSEIFFMGSDILIGMLHYGLGHFWKRKQKANGQISRAKKPVWVRFNLSEKRRDVGGKASESDQ